MLGLRQSRHARTRQPVFGWSASGPVVGAPALSSIAAGGSATCGLTPQRELWCWGGAAPSGRSAVPVRVLEGTEVSAVSVGYSNNTDLTQAGTLVCALTTAGAPWCWGHLVGRVPLQLADTRRFMAIRTARGSDGCGMLGAGQPDAGRIACWTDIRSPAVVIAGDYGTFTSWEVGIDGGCGLDAAGEAWCWRRDGAVATRAAGGLRFSALAVAASLTCGLTTSGAEMICWGQHPRLYYALPGLVRAARDDRFTGLVRSETGVCGWRANASLACFGFGILAVDQP